MTTSKSEIEAAVRRASRQGKLSCKTAFKLAESLAVTPRKVGAVANELKIKIVGCQLGLFK
ncbi:MAG: hypothetical protein P9M14_13200 [Candidatus Alcyoniella australis]|nr:hypothetical protein [Candidatus Alcyoniella australis]